MSTALITVEGVLGEHSNVHGFHPLVDGVRLAKSLRSEYQVMFSTTQENVEGVEFWLRINGMTKPSFYEDLLYREASWGDLTEEQLVVAHARVLRSRGADLNLFVSADPHAVLGATELGFPCLFFVNPAYRWAEYRPDFKRLPRPWQDIDDEVVRQRDLKASDPRLNELEDV